MIGFLLGASTEGKKKGGGQKYLIFGYLCYLPIIPYGAVMASTDIWLKA